MPKVETSERFEQDYVHLPIDIRKKVAKAMRLLAENPRHPSLRAKPVHGIAGVFEARVDVSYRMTYERLPGDLLFLRSVGKHDETLKNP
jgi:mRNA-degrading endonuclease YafQ of YafQ-DinJ toxin-antitoxin module